MYKGYIILFVIFILSSVLHKNISKINYSIDYMNLLYTFIGILVILIILRNNIILRTPEIKEGFSQEEEEEDLGYGEEEEDIYDEESIIVDKILRGNNVTTKVHKDTNEKKVVNINEGHHITQDKVKGVGNIFAPRIVIKKKDVFDPSTISPPKNYEDIKASVMKSQHYRHYNTDKSSYAKSCPDPYESRKKKEKTYYPGYSFMPPVMWDVPQERNSVCKTVAGCEDYPMPILAKGIPKNALEYYGIDSELPKEKEHEKGDRAFKCKREALRALKAPLGQREIKDSVSSEEINALNYNSIRNSLMKNIYGNQTIDDCPPLTFLKERRKVKDYNKLECSTTNSLRGVSEKCRKDYCNELEGCIYKDKKCISI